MLRSQAPMSMDDVRRVCPAAFQTQPHQRTTEYYTPISTADILTRLEEKGLGISRAQQKNTRTKDSMEFARHLVCVRPLESFTKPVVGDAAPEVIIINGHDGLTSYQVQLGLFRFVCANGLMVGDQFSTFSVSHRGDILDEVEDATQNALDMLPQLSDWVQRAHKVKLNKSQLHNFSTRAMEVRYGEARPFSPEKLLEARRPEDEGNVVWNVFNRVQENLMKGGQEGKSANGRRSTMRPINRVTKDVIYNRKLWDLASEFVEEAA